MPRTHGRIPLALISRALISLQGRKEGFRELFPTLSRSVHAAVMLQLSLDPGIYAVFPASALPTEKATLVCDT